MRLVNGAIFAVLLALSMAASKAQAATYSLTFSNGAFTIDAALETDGDDVVQSITGTMTRVGQAAIAISSIVPTNTTDATARRYWLWNNRFSMTAPYVDWYGLLWQHADGSYANLYTEGGRNVLSFANPSRNEFGSYMPNLSVLAVTQVNPVLPIVAASAVSRVASVPVPGAAILFGSGLLGLGYLAAGRKRATAAS